MPVPFSPPLSPFPRPDESIQQVAKDLNDGEQTTDPIDPSLPPTFTGDGLNSASNGDAAILQLLGDGTVTANDIAKNKSN